MRKFLMLVLAASSILSSCSKDEQLETAEVTNFNALVTKASDLQATGVYKGTFASYDNENRGIVMIQINQAGKAQATLQFANGEETKLLADSQTSKSGLYTEVTFVNDVASFRFSVAQDGSAPRVSGLELGAAEGSMKVLKETTRGPLLPISGTYTCDNCEIHPLLESGVTQTFNATTVSGGGNNEQQIVTQIILNGKDFGSSTGNTQSGCANSGGIRTCTIAGASATIIGTRAINWSGTHRFTPGGTSCSEVSGTWSFNSQYGLLTGTFISDSTCGF
ncbi:hypothetical protein [Gilvibacter sp.]|uniref:hypothetical protein n=1 Tax=Gilvibacter sp. TaxID=2729997 RepID=UPI0035BE34C1